MTGSPKTGDTLATAVYSFNYVPEKYDIMAEMKSDDNAYIIFDYRDETDFKFAGLDENTNKWVIGHYDGDFSSNVYKTVDWDDTNRDIDNDFYEVHVRVDGRNVTLSVDGEYITDHTFSNVPYLDQTHARIGMAADNATAYFDSFRVDSEIIYVRSFDAINEGFDGYTSGQIPTDWTANTSTFGVEVYGGDEVLEGVFYDDLNMAEPNIPGMSTNASLPPSYEVGVNIEVYSGTNDSYSGLITFDIVDGNNFKYAGLIGNATDGYDWVIGHYDNGWDHKSEVSAGTPSDSDDFDLKVSVDTNVVTLYVGGVQKGTHTFAGIDSLHHSNRIGLTGYYSTTRFDDFELGITV